jgi:hypothetical protein
MRQPHEEAAYLGEIPLVIDAADAARATFLRRTYAHVAGAIGALVLVEIALFQTGFAWRFTTEVVATSPWAWLAVLGVYMLVGGIARRWAVSDTSSTTQYLGLGLYVAASAVLLAPLLVVASVYGGAEIIGTAALITAVVFSGLTGYVLVSGKDFSFLGGALSVLGFAAVGLIVCSVVFGFTLGVVFTVAMIALVCGYIVYDTSTIQRHYPINKHVAASLALLASVVTLFWYVLQLLLYLQRRN